VVYPAESQRKSYAFFRQLVSVLVSRDVLAIKSGNRAAGLSPWVLAEIGHPESQIRPLAGRPREGHIRKMKPAIADAPKPPASYARQRPDGSWFVAVTWQNGRQEQMGKFKTSTEAEDFIELQLLAWHDGFKQVPHRR
jgi:hypothetical protein